METLAGRYWFCWMNRFYKKTRNASPATEGRQKGTLIC
nr:MAG TPA: hypothetical protein [Caudoviricetes sp.]